MIRGVSSDEEDFPSEDNNLFRAWPSQKQQPTLQAVVHNAKEAISHPAKQNIQVQGSEKKSKPVVILLRDNRGCSHYQSIYQHSGLANTPGCCSRNQERYQSPSQANAQGHSSHNQVQGRTEKRTSSHTATKEYVEQSMPQRNQEMGRPSPRRRKKWPHTQTTQPPPLQQVTRGGTALPPQLNRIEEYPHNPVTCSPIWPTRSL
ncbi:hypothetical protein OS493_013196 [Desmophyllum pertusum]|uniref:Uncharacterized protein n=1 Tax=Desmophyllum pertusum TaxID=174260 RepID=A0A9W9YQ14_9CNID|nr:hypothetical protein OS493_013196 [Desmophyllum pertusum]